MSFTQIPVTCAGGIVTADGQPASGTLTFIPTRPMRNGAVLVEAPVVCTVTAGQPEEDFTLAAVDDDDTTPPGVQYQVIEEIGGSVATYYVTPSVDDDAIDLGTVARAVDSPPEVLAYAPLGANGKVPSAYLPAGSGGSGVSDHGDLDGLSDDDHPQYLNVARGDARYPLATAVTTALAGKQASGDYATNTALTSGLAGKQDTGDYATNTALTSGLAGKAAASHAHSGADITSGTVPVAQLPTGTSGSTVALGNHTHSYAATSHTHATSDVTGLDTALAGKASSSHTHAQSDVTNLVSDLAAKATTSALTSHTSDTANPHAVTKTQVGLGNVDNTADTAKPISTATQTALDGKAATSHNHSAADLTSGTVATVRLGSGTASSSTFLRGDQTWAAPTAAQMVLPQLPRSGGYMACLAPVGTASIPNSVARPAPIYLAAPATADRIGIEVTTGVASAAVYLAIYNHDATTNLPGTVLLDAGSIDASTTGFKEITISQALSVGVYWLAAYNTGGPGTRVQNTMPVVSYMSAQADLNASVVAPARTGLVSFPSPFAASSAATASHRVYLRFA